MPYMRLPEMRGICGNSVPRIIPEGRVLHHNHVQHESETPCGQNGFRAWTSPTPLDGFVPCPCKWSGLPHLALREHVNIYRKDGTRKKGQTFEAESA